MTDNLELWKSVEKTDTTFTKQVNQRGGYTAISPQYQAKMATEKFGPYGHGWGLQESEFDMRLFEATGMVIHKALFFYLLDGNVQTFPISNSICPQTGKEGQKRNDEDWAKKVETNTISKALSRLGFNADIFLGLFDDYEYVETLKTEEAIDKAGDKDAAIIEKQTELKDYVKRQLEAIKEYNEMTTVNGVVKAATRHLQRQKSIPSLAELAEAGILAIVRDATAKKASIGEGEVYPNA